jgi:hypothetical protein
MAPRASSAAAADRPRFGRETLLVAFAILFLGLLLSIVFKGWLRDEAVLAARQARSADPLEREAGFRRLRELGPRAAPELVRLAGESEAAGGGPALEALEAELVEGTLTPELLAAAVTRVGPPAATDPAAAELRRALAVLFPGGLILAVAPQTYVVLGGAAGAGGADAGGAPSPRRRCTVAVQEQNVAGDAAPELLLVLNDAADPGADRGVWVRFAVLAREAESLRLVWLYDPSAGLGGERWDGSCAVVDADGDGRAELVLFYRRHGPSGAREQVAEFLIWGDGGGAGAGGGGFRRLRVGGAEELVVSGENLGARNWAERYAFTGRLAWARHPALAWQVLLYERTATVQAGRKLEPPQTRQWFYAYDPASGTYVEVRPEALRRLRP